MTRRVGQPRVLMPVRVGKIARAVAHADMHRNAILPTLPSYELLARGMTA